MRKGFSLWALAVLALVFCCCSEPPVPKITKYHDIVTVDYGKSIEELLESGNYDVVEDGISDVNFNVGGLVGVAKPDFELVHFKKGMNTQDVLNYLKENDLRPATIQELLAFGAALPDMQRGFAIIALGSSCYDMTSTWKKKYRSLPRLDSHGDCRTVELGLNQYFGWSGDCRFLAVHHVIVVP